jgi:hypothetical protein
MKMCSIIHIIQRNVESKPHYCMIYQSLSADLVINDGYIIL